MGARKGDLKSGLIDFSLLPVPTPHSGQQSVSLPVVIIICIVHYHDTKSEMADATMNTY